MRKCYNVVDRFGRVVEGGFFSRTKANESCKEWNADRPQAEWYSVERSASLVLREAQCLLAA